MNPLGTVRSGKSGSSLAKLALGACLCGSVLSAPVDTELLILVDAQTYSTSDFDLILDSAARTFESPTFQQAVLNGLTGRMAASVQLFNTPATGTGVTWTELTSPAAFAAFATSVRSIVNPNIGGNVDYAAAITNGAASIASNSFEGTTRQITIIDDATGFWEANPTGTRAARDAALASSVDVINAVAFDAQYRETAVTNYYNANIVSPGGSLSVVSTPQGGAKTTAQMALVVGGVMTTASEPTALATAAIPEPSSSLLVVLGSMLLAFRRRRD